MLVNLKNYKVAKEFVSDYKIMFKILDLATRGLEPFRHYKPIASLLHEMKNTKTILAAHNNTAEKIIQGSKDGE